MSDTQDPYVRPDSIDEACEILRTHGPDAKVVAGGQSLSLLLRQNLLDPAVIVDVSELPGMQGIRTDEERIHVGATTTYTTLETDDRIEEVGALADSVDVIADAQVRNLGTIGGAIAHADPSLDVLPPLLCLDATLVVAGPDGRRTVEFDAFYDGYMETDLGDGEVVAGLSIRAPRPGSGSAYEKYASVDGGWATVGAASAIELDADGDTIERARVALAAVDDTPVRAPTAESRLEGEPATDDVLADAADQIPEDIAPLEDLSGSVPYKESLSVRLGTRSLERSLERAQRGETR